MRRHPRPTEPSSSCRSTTRGRFLRLGSLALIAAGVVALAGFSAVDDSHARTGGPRFRTTEQPATALGPLVELP